MIEIGELDFNWVQTYHNSFCLLHFSRMSMKILIIVFRKHSLFPAYWNRSCEFSSNPIQYSTYLVWLIYIGKIHVHKITVFSSINGSWRHACQVHKGLISLRFVSWQNGADAQSDVLGIGRLFLFGAEQPRFPVFVPIDRWSDKEQNTGHLPRCSSRVRPSTSGTWGLWAISLWSMIVPCLQTPNSPSDLSLCMERQSEVRSPPRQNQSGPYEIRLLSSFSPKTNKPKNVSFFNGLE